MKDLAEFIESHSRKELRPEPHERGNIDEPVHHLPSGEGILFRPAREDDRVSVASLLSSLGYPVCPSEVLPILQTVLRTSHVEVFLACLDGSQVVGLISLLHFPSLRLQGYQVDIEELVVHRQHRGKGIGRELIRFAVNHAQAKGAVMIEVLTNRGRESFTRRFYEKNGFSLSDHAVYRLEPKRP